MDNPGQSTNVNKIGGEIKIRVKSASHRCEDINLSCQLSDTVKNVKEIIKQEFPLHPETEEQRLIYAGQLLEDQQILRDVFNYSGQANLTGGFTVHLACNSTFLRKASRTLGKEVNSNPESENKNNVSQPNSNFATSQQVPNQNQIPTGTVGVPQDVLALHSLYVQQMMNFMAQWGGGNYPAEGQRQWTPISNPTVGVNQLNFAPTNYQQRPQQFVVPPHNNLQPPQEPAVINQPLPPQPAPVRNEVADDDHPRDMLDWLYTLSRLILILSVVYFYSNMTRFLLVVIFTALIFVIQRRPRLAENEAVQNPDPQPNLPRVRAAEPVPQPNPINGNQGQANAGTDGQTEANVGATPTDDVIPEAQAQQQPQPQRLHALDIGRNFLMSFFTSLIPEMHPN